MAKFRVNCLSLENRNIIWIQKNGNNLVTCKRTITKQPVFCGITLQLMPELVEIILQMTIIGVGIYMES